MPKFAQHNSSQYLRFLFRWHQARHGPPHMVSYERHIHEMFKGSKKTNWEQLKTDLKELEGYGLVLRRKEYGWEYGLTEKGIREIIKDGIPEEEVRKVYPDDGYGRPTEPAVTNGLDPDGEADIQGYQDGDGEVGRVAEASLNSEELPATADVGAD